MNRRAAAQRARLGRQEYSPMEEIPKSVKQALRKLASAAHEEELRRALMPLRAKLDRWTRGEWSSRELSNSIYDFHQGPLRQLFGRYNSGMPAAAVAHAIVSGFINRSDVPPTVLAYLARALACYGSQREASEESPR